MAVDKPATQTLDDEIERSLLKSRRLFFSAAVDTDSATDAIRKLWFLEQQGPGEPILFIINSPGGSIDAGFAIWDQMKMITSPVTTLVTGIAASMGSVLSLAGGPGRRYATPNCRVMIHQPAIHGTLQGQATDLEIHAREILKTRDRLIALYVEASGKDRETIARAIDRDTWMSAKEAQAYGLIDKIVTSFSEIK